MDAVLVGADRLGNIPDVLAEFGIAIRQHVSGRDKAHQRKAVSLPSGTHMVILFTDFLGHNVMQSFRSAAQRQGVSVVCCRRSVCSLRRALDCQFGQDPTHCAGCPARGGARSV
jgi:hypothetical protein